LLKTVVFLLGEADTEMMGELVHVRVTPWWLGEGAQEQPGSDTAQILWLWLSWRLAKPSPHPA
jgi:hypothetical protein